MDTVTQGAVRPPMMVAGVGASEVARRLGVDVAVGLSPAEPARRLQSNGPDKFAGGETESGFRAFVRPHEVGATMLLTTLSIFHVAAGLLWRDQTNTIFGRDAVPGAAQRRRYGASLLAVVAITAPDILQRIFGTSPLTGNQWANCRGLAASLVVLEELIKPAPRHTTSICSFPTTSAVATPSPLLSTLNYEESHALQPPKPQLPQGAGLHS